MTVLADPEASREAAEDALRMKVEDLNKAVSPPTAAGGAATASSSRIERYIAAVGAKWEEYERAHYALKAKLTVNTQNPADCPVTKLETNFDQLYRVQQDSVDDAHDELEKRKTKEDYQAPDVSGSLQPRAEDLVEEEIKPQGKKVEKSGDTINRVPAPGGGQGEPLAVGSLVRPGTGELRLGNCQVKKGHAPHTDQGTHTSRRYS